MKHFALAFLSALLALASCSDNEATTPSYRQDVACLVADTWGNAGTLLRDDGTRLKVSNSISGLTPDSTYRVLALYTEDTAAATAHLTSYAEVLTVPAATYRTTSLVTDPLSVAACWMSGGYVNLHLSLKASNAGVHYFGIHKQSVTRHADGSQTLNLLLIHSQNQDPLYYSRDAYLSMPVRPLLSEFSEGRDSLSLSINTFEEKRTFRFAL